MTANAPARLDSAILSSRPVRPVCDSPSIHTYFDVNPESPDGRWVTWFAFDGKPLVTGTVMIGSREDGRVIEVAQTRGVTHCGARQGWLDSNHIYFSAGGKIHVADTNGQIVQSVDGAVNTLNKAARQGLGFSEGIRKFGGVPTKEEACYRFDLDTGEATELIDRDEAWDVITGQAGSPFADTPIESKQYLSFRHTKWSPDGSQWLVVITDERHQLQFGKPATIKVILTADPDGGNLRLVDSFGHHPIWLPDSSGIIAFKGTHNIDVWKNGCGAESLTSTPFEGHPSVRPDMRYLSTDGYDAPDTDYASMMVKDLQTGDQEIVVQMPYPRFDWQTQHPPRCLCHLHPVWSADGRRLYFNAVNKDMPRLCCIDFDDDPDIRPRELKPVTQHA